MEFEWHVSSRVCKGSGDIALCAGTVISVAVSDLVARDTYMCRDPTKENRANGCLRLAALDDRANSRNGGLQVNGPSQPTQQRLREG